MSTRDVEAALGLIIEHAERCHFAGPRDPSVGEWYIVRGSTEEAAAESPVEILHATVGYDQPTEVATPDFGSFFLDSVRAGLNPTSP